MSRCPGSLLIAFLVLAAMAGACGGDSVAETEPPPPDPLVDLPPEPPPEPRVPGVLVELDESESPLPGFGAIRFKNDIPGHLREHEDQVLATLGEIARDDDRLLQGFQNLREEKFFFVVQIRMRDDQDANDVVAHIRGLELSQILEFIAPEDELFEGRLEPDPEVPGEGAIAHFFLRHGLSDEGGGRIQDVGNDVIVLARGGTVLFIEGRSPQDVEAPTRVDAEAIELARLLSALLEDAYAEKVAEATAG